MQLICGSKHLEVTLDSNWERKCVYALCQCHYPLTDSHHLVRPCRNNIFSKDKFLLSFLCTGIIIIIIIIINKRKCLLLPKKIFALVHNTYSNSKAVSSEGWSVGYKGFLYYSWTSSATQAGSLFYWDNSFFFSPKTSVQHHAFYFCWFSNNLKSPLSFPKQYKMGWHQPFTDCMNNLERICVSLLS